MYEYVSVDGYLHVYRRACGSRKRKLEFLVTISHLSWVPGTEFSKGSKYSSPQIHLSSPRNKFQLSFSLIMLKCTEK